MSNSEKKLVHIQTPDDTFVVEYPEAIEFMKKQQAVFWLFDETDPAKDKHDLMVNLTESERHGVTTTLKIFTLLEKIIGSFWEGFVCKRFPRDADIIPMATMFGSIELCVHERFYATINEEMGLATKEFYNEYKYDPVLKARIDSMMDTLAHKDDLRTIGGFSFFEGAILFSSFAFLKSFQLNGNNKILNIVAGINFSCHDESTEVLTDEGWVNIGEINLSHNVAQFDVNTKEIDFEHPLDTVNTPSNTSYLFEGENFSQRVTGDHRMVTTDGIVRAKDAEVYTTQYIGGDISGDAEELTDEDKLAFTMIADGSLDKSWFYNRIPYVSTKWAREALEFLQGLTSH